MKEQDNADQEEAEGERKQEATLITTLRRSKQATQRKTGRGKTGFMTFPRRALAAPAKRPRGTEPKRTTEEAREIGTRQQGDAERGERKLHSKKRLQSEMLSLVVLRGRITHPGSDDASIF